jgi:hypothetical protein
MVGSNKEEKSESKSGSPGGTRTPDLVINSHPLYQLSYRGSNAKYATTVLYFTVSVNLVERSEHCPLATEHRVQHLPPLA